MSFKNVLYSNFKTNIIGSESLYLKCIYIFKNQKSKKQKYKTLV